MEHEQLLKAIAMIVRDYDEDRYPSSTDAMEAVKATFIKAEIDVHEFTDDE